MMERYRAAVSGAVTDPQTRRLVLAYYGLRPTLRSGQVFGELQRWGASQADLVLMLVRAGRREAASVIVGRPVPRVCPPALRAGPPTGARRAGDSLEQPDLLDRVVLRVEPNPRLPTTPAWSRYREFRPGRTLRSSIARGATRRDVRIAMRRGWLRLQPTA